VQLELGDRRIIVENVDPAEMTALLSRSEQRSETVLDSATAGRLRELAAILESAGFLTATQPGPTAEPPVAARLHPDLGAMSAQFGDAARPMLLARRSAAVAVHGTSRLAASVAATLAAAGIGRVQLVHGGEVAAADACPGGLAPADEGRRFAVAAVEAVRRSAPDVDTAPLSGTRSANLVVLTDPLPVDTTVQTSLHLDGKAHLVTSVEDHRAVVGPLVVPGVSSCLRCADLHRTDRDPAWPALAVQLANRPRRRLGADVALCVATAGVAAGQALSYLDRQQPATLGATLEWQPPDWRLRRRGWPAHHRCDCGAATAAAKHGRMCL
jgi:hypothetical protein